MSFAHISAYLLLELTLAFLFPLFANAVMMQVNTEAGLVDVQIPSGVNAGDQLMLQFDPEVAPVAVAQQNAAILADAPATSDAEPATSRAVRQTGRAERPGWRPRSTDETSPTLQRARLAGGRMPSSRSPRSGHAPYLTERSDSQLFGGALVGVDPEVAPVAVAQQNAAILADAPATSDAEPATSRAVRQTGRAERPGWRPRSTDETSPTLQRARLAGGRMPSSRSPRSGHAPYLTERSDSQLFGGALVGVGSEGPEQKNVRRGQRHCTKTSIITRIAVHRTINAVGNTLLHASAPCLLPL